MRIGRIVKSISGFFYVLSEDSIIVCRARGKVKSDELTPLVGDIVEYSRIDNNSGVIETILPRKNSFIRPAVSNVDMLVFIASEVIPVTDPFLIDRFSVVASHCGCDFLLCINKTDLTEKSFLNGIYRNTGIKVLNISAATGLGFNELRALLSGKISVLTGNSGVGKSSIINLLLPEANTATAEVSVKLGRGKHTTRVTQLHILDKDTLVADTPGFSSFDVNMITNLESETLSSEFVDFTEYQKCRFTNCSHINEPGCAVIRAVTDGKIQKSRYDSYCRLLQQIKNNSSY